MTIIVKYFRILNLENNCHTASPDTIGKLTENKIINHLSIFLLMFVIYTKNNSPSDMEAATPHQLLYACVYTYCLMVEAGAHDWLLELFGVRVGGTG